MIVRPLELSPKSGPEASHATDPRPHRRRGPAGAAQILSRREGAAAALESKDAGAVSTARQDVMLAARQAADVLHHLSDFVLKEPSTALTFTKIEDVRSAVEAKCVFLRTPNPVADVGLLRDVTDAFSTIAQTGRVRRSWFRPTSSRSAAAGVRCAGVKASMAAPSRASSRQKTATSGRCRRSYRTSLMPG